MLIRVIRGLPFCIFSCTLVHFVANLFCRRQTKKAAPIRGRFQYDDPGLISNQDSDRSWRSAEFQTAEPATGSGSWNKPGQVLSG